MGRNSMKTMKDGQDATPKAFEDLEVFVGGGSHKANKRAMGRRNSNVRFNEMRLSRNSIEMDYQYSTGGGVLTGTMSLPYSRDEPFGEMVENMLQLGEDAFHNLRRQRD